MSRRPAARAPVPDRTPSDYVRLPEVMQRTGLSRPTIYRKITEGTFPARVQLSANCVAWVERDLVAWLQNPMEWKAAA